MTRVALRQVRRGRWAHTAFPMSHFDCFGHGCVPPPRRTHTQHDLHHEHAATVLHRNGTARMHTGCTSGQRDAERAAVQQETQARVADSRGRWPAMADGRPMVRPCGRDGRPGKLHERDAHRPPRRTLEQHTSSVAARFHQRDGHGLHRRKGGFFRRPQTPASDKETFGLSL